MCAKCRPLILMPTRGILTACESFQVAIPRPIHHLIRGADFALVAVVLCIRGSSFKTRCLATRHKLDQRIQLVRDLPDGETPPPDRCFLVFETASGHFQLLQLLDRQRDRIRGHSWSACCRRHRSSEGGRDPDLKLIEREIGVLPFQHEDQLNSIAWLDNGKSLLTTSPEGVHMCGTSRRTNVSTHPYTITTIGFMRRLTVRDAAMP